jgi:two-component system cell cycle response regulator
MVHKHPAWRTFDGPRWRPDGEEVAVAALLELVEEAAPEVAAHMERTARLARVFALELGLSGPLLNLVVRTAQLHDVGKLAIPPWVLEKPGPLTRSELSLMEAHPVTGQKILERKPALMSIGPLVRATHERWDGTGYPDLLKGSAIPIPARIVAVCDAFDAMTHPRPYSSSMGIESALDEVRRGSGKQFDPGVVEPFCAVFEERIDRRAQGA